MPELENETTSTRTTSRAEEASAPTESGLRTYSESVARGFYERPVGGLFGKLDNVRTHWEDALTRLTLRPYIKERLQECRAQGRGLRILDLGCGAGEGYECLTRIPEKDLSLDVELRHVVEPADIALYLGIDLSEDMVRQGRENYASHPGVRFEEVDLRDGLGPAESEPPFDVYFSSYGALSHLDGPGLERCLDRVVAHAAPGALVVLDLIGRFSPEWPGYWGGRTEAEKYRDYSMSYLIPEDERRTRDIDRFPLRFWSGAEVHQLCARVGARHASRVSVLTALDRSIFVGRHVDTREYACPLPPLRGVVNRLFERDLRTPLEALRVPHPPTSEAAEAADASRFFSGLARAWNALVDFTIARISGERIDIVDLDGWYQFPPALQMALLEMDRVVDSVAWLRGGDVRANVIEPQLAYMLRRLERGLQRGRGCGHGLVAVLRVGDLM